MKRFYLMAVATFMSVAAWAQNIAVVSPGNSTNVYQTLDDAIAGAAPGSTIYLPGGGFQIKDETTIDKKLTIMGVSHRGDTDNVDGATVIAGNLNFVGGSSGSAVVGVYVTGNINVGETSAAVTNFTLRYCNVNIINVQNSESAGMVVNQCYLRSGAKFGYCNVKITNCICREIVYINGGTIDHNIFTSRSGPDGYYGRSLPEVNNSSITNNFFFDWGNAGGSNCQSSNNCIGTGSWGDNPVVLDEGTTWDDVFYANKGVSISSDYRLKGSWGKGKATDGTDIGIYGGSGFNPKALAPIPRIVSKKVDEQTDGSSKLKVEVKVKAN